jgi:hypothetical protein
MAPTKAGGGSCRAWRVQSTAHLPKRVADLAALGRHTARRSYQSGRRILLRLAGTGHYAPTKAGDGSAGTAGHCNLPKRAADPAAHGRHTARRAYHSGGSCNAWRACNTARLPKRATAPAALGKHRARRAYRSGRRTLLRLAGTQSTVRLPKRATDPAALGQAHSTAGLPKQVTDPAARGGHRARCTYQSG